MEKYIATIKIILSILVMAVSAISMEYAENHIGPMKYSGDQFILEFMASMAIFLTTLSIVLAIAIWEMPDAWKSKPKN